MLKRKYRLGKNVGFYNSSAFSSPFFTLKIKKNNFLYNRFGIIVSKKTEKRAVGRNRVRRVLSACLLELQKELLPGHDVLFIVKTGSLGKKQKEMYMVTWEMFKKTGLIS